MAFRWRIRHKLTLGLGLVIGIIALLLAGTVYGLQKFRVTLKSINNKHAELAEAETFIEKVSGLKAAMGTRGGNLDEMANLNNALEGAKTALNQYDVRLQRTVSQEWNPNHNENEGPLVVILKRSLSELERAVEEARGQPTANPLAPSQSFADVPAIHKSLDDLSHTSTELRDAIYETLDKRSSDAERDV